MAWTSMHFAVGMCGGAALTIVPCLLRGRGWRWVPLGMTLGGLWGVLPDLPRLWREDFPSLPFATTLGSSDFEAWLHSIGDLFFLHRTLDAQPREYALLGLAIIIGLYNLCLFGFLLQRRGRTDSIDARTDLADAQTQSKHPSAEFSTDVSDESAPTIVGRVGRNRSA